MERPLLALAGIAYAAVHLGRAVRLHLGAVGLHEGGSVDAGLDQPPCGALHGIGHHGLVHHVRRTGLGVALVARAHQVAVAVAPAAQLHLLAAVGAERDPAKQRDGVAAGRGARVARHQVLHHVELVAADDGRVRSFGAEPLLRRPPQRLSAAERRRVRSALHQRARIHLVCQDAAHRVGVPARGPVAGERLRVAHALAALVLGGARGAHAVQVLGDGGRGLAVELHPEHQPHVRRRVRVDRQAAPSLRVLHVAVGHVGASALSALHLGVQAGAGLDGGVAADVVVEEPLERHHQAGGVGVARGGVVGVVHHDHAHPAPAVHLGEHAL